MENTSQTRTGPLTNLRVLDLGTMLAGPVAATMLADFGADVIKVEQPGSGDSLRGLGPFIDGESLWFQLEGRNKRCVSIDLRKPEGQELLRSLAKHVDVLIENFRPGTLDKWGIGYSVLAEVNPRLVMLSISGFGQTGPNASRAAYDRIAMAYSGLMAATGYKDRAPVRTGGSVADYSTATLGAFSVMMALYSRDANGGKGQHIDLALYEAAFRFTDTMALAYDKLGMVRSRMGNLSPAAAPGNTYETKEGRYLIITISGDVLFKKLCRAIDRADLLELEKYSTHDLRWKNVDELNDILGQWIRARDVEEISERLTEYGVPFSPVFSVEDIFNDSHYAARDSMLTVEHPKIGALRMQGIFPKLSATPAGPLRHAHAVGEDNEGVFKELLGLKSDEVADLKQQGII